ncbi:MAG: LemA family protein [Candidatus Micrarchaeota archaeon]|nr:LemA family protein [Candidatus Micrarchaeota archaeon]
MVLVFLIAGAVVLAAVVLFFVLVYNGLVALKNDIKKSWANIDVLLMQRSSELPKLVESVKGYMAHEQGVLESLTRARTAFLNAKSVGEKAAADGMLSGALKTLFAVSENYPQLRATENFQQLQSRISGLENEIADRREFYNNAVNLYNIRIQSIPDVFIANVLAYKAEEMFKVPESARQDVQIKF